MSGFLGRVCSSPNTKYVTGAIAATAVPAALYAGYMASEWGDVTLVQDVVSAAKNCLNNNVSCTNSCNFVDWCAIGRRMHPVPLLPTIASFGLPILNAIGGITGRLLIEKMRDAPPSVRQDCTKTTVVKTGLFIGTALLTVAAPFLEGIDHYSKVNSIAPRIDQCVQNLFNCTDPCPISSWCSALSANKLGEFQNLICSGIASPAAALFGWLIGADVGRSFRYLPKELDPPKEPVAEVAATPEEVKPLVTDE